MINLNSNHPNVRNLTYDPQFQIIEGTINGMPFQLDVEQIGNEIPTLPEDKLYELLHSLVVNTTPTIAKGYKMGDAVAYLDKPDGDNYTFFGSFGN